MNAMKMKCSVRMLPTDKNSNLELGLEGGYLYLNRKSPVDERIKAQHLYIVSDDKIKEGDWYIDGADSVRQSVTSDEDYWEVRKDYKKVIETTDSSLGLPSPSCQSFVEQYVHEHNYTPKSESGTHLCTCLSACQCCAWVPVGVRLPEKGGKYLVMTESIFMKSVHRFDALLVVSDTKKTWNVSNQVVTHWLDESHTHLCTCVRGCV
jgi:hypothetical protein